MKTKLKNAYKPVSERFSYAVEAALNEAEHTAPAKKRLSNTARAVIAAALILALVPSAVFGASKLIGLIAKPAGSYGVELDMETVCSDYPEYVSMNVNIPEGFEEVEGTDGMKYHRIGDTEYRSGFSLFPMRYSNGGSGEVIGNVNSYEEITVCGRSAYRVGMLGEGVYSRLYISYEEFNVTLIVFYNEVTDDELNAFVGGISFTEGTKADHTELGEPFDERIKDDMVYTYNYKNIEFDRDTVMTFSGYSQLNGDESLRYTAQISGIAVKDDISGLDSAHFNSMYTDESLTDNSGKLLPRTVTVTKGGNGFDTVDKVISSEEKEQKLVLIDILYTNLSDENTVVFLPYDLGVLDKRSDGTYDNAQNIDPEQNIYSSALCDSEKLYVSDPLDTIHSFYCTELKAGETRTVTIGFRCCADMLDKAYLTIYDATSANIVDPYPETGSSEDIPNYIIKVL